MTEAIVSIPIAGAVLEMSANIRYSGIISAANGIIIDRSRMLNTISFSLLRKISKPYPAKEAITIARMVVNTDIFAEFQRDVHRSVDSANFLKFSNRWLPGSSLPLVTSTDLFVALTTIHKKGKIEINAAPPRNT
ncbi:hypothetical protein D3C77_618220 [compost metagenome]